MPLDRGPITSNAVRFAFSSLWPFASRLPSAGALRLRWLRPVASLGETRTDGIANRFRVRFQMKLKLKRSEQCQAPVKVGSVAGLPALDSLGTTDGHGATRMRGPDPWHPCNPWWSWAGLPVVDEASCLVVWDDTAGNPKQPEDRCGSGREYLGAEARCLSHDGGSLREPSFRRKTFQVNEAPRPAPRARREGKVCSTPYSLPASRYSPPPPPTRCFPSSYSPLPAPRPHKGGRRSRRRANAT